MKNKFGLFSTGVLSLFGLLIFFACEKEQLNNNINNSSKEAVVLSSSAECNVFDYYGINHNNGVALIMSYETELNELADDEMATRQFILQTIEEFISTIEFQGTTPPDDLDGSWDLLFDVDLNDYHTILEQSDLTDHEKAILAEYFSQFTNFDLESETGVAAFIDYTENLECSLVNNEEIVNEELVLATLSISRYSMEFWYAFNNDLGGDSAYRKVDPGSVVLADAMGGMYGSAIPLWGSLVGAVGGSAFTAIAQWRGW